MEFIFHLIGLCPDTQNHFDLIDLIAIWDTASVYLSRISFLGFKILDFIKIIFK